MKFIAAFLYILYHLLITSVAYADEITFYQIEIEHPGLGELPKPLIITITERYRKSGEYISRYKYWPMIYDRFSVIEGKEHIVGSDDQWDEYYDAFPTLDKKGYILVRKWRSPEWSRLVEIEFDRRILINPRGEKIFWSKDGKYLVTATLPSPFYEAELALYFYDFEKGKQMKLVNEIKFNKPDKLKFYIKENLISAEDRKDVRLIIIQKEKK